MHENLVELEKRMLEADAAADAAFFEANCAEDFIAVTSYGISTKKDVVAMYEGGTADPSRRSELADERVMPLGEGVAAVVYTLISATPDETTKTYATSVYRRSGEAWQLALLQHTRA